MLTKDLGRLSDIMGRKGAMLLALSLFGRFFEFLFREQCCSSLLFSGSGTLLCGLAPSMDSLIIARAIAGMGGGG